MKPNIAKSLAALLSAALLGVTLAGCTPTLTPEEELEAVSVSTSHTAARDYKPIHLNDYIHTDLYDVTFEYVYFSPAFVRIGDLNSIDFVVQGTFTNNSMETYRLESSAEAQFEINDKYVINAKINPINNGSISSNGYTREGESTQFVVRATIPKSAIPVVNDSIVTFSLYQAFVNNGTYGTHSSEQIGGYIFQVPYERIDR